MIAMQRRQRLVIALLFAGLCWPRGTPVVCAAGAPASAAADKAPWVLLADPEDGLSFAILRDGQAVGRVSMGGWGPKWAWVGLGSKDHPEGDTYAVTAPFTVNRSAGQTVSIRLAVAQMDARTVTFRYDLSADRDVPLTLLAATVHFDKTLPGQLGVWADGKETNVKLPPAIRAFKAAPKAVFKLDGIGDVAVGIDPPVAVGLDADARFILAEERFSAGAKAVTLTLTFPADVQLATRRADLARFTRNVADADWFPFMPAAGAGAAAIAGASVIGMEDWLEKPAGKRGGVRVAGDAFTFEDGTPVKFWGTNLAYGGNCAPEKKAADFTAARFATYGVNAVRLHKFSYPKNQGGIGDPADSTRMDPAGIDRLDYFADQLKQHGVYFGWSHTYGFHVTPGERKRLVAYDEIVKAFPDGNTYAFINFAPDVQDVMIEMVVNLLKHKNAYTGLTYADEPALCFVEMQNEDDIFFYTSEKALNACPTYRKLFIERFSDWLKTKYGSEAAFGKAWEGALKAGESVAARNIVPQTNPWFFSDAHLPQVQGGERQRLLDTAAFLHDVQNQYYAKFLKAIREAGYKGPVLGSPWQGPSMLPHYYNLRSDYLAGYIDRHNYFGGKLTESMLAHPGSGYLSTGLQQVLDRPFGLSEWITVYPSLYSAEGPALLAAYGMGLQGWDASYEFQSQAGTRAFDDRAGWMPWGVWEGDTPTQLGQYPSLARMIYRGDVKQGPVISVRRVSPAEMAAGKFGFSDQVRQKGDVKDFGGAVGPESLAAGRVAVQFTDSPEASTFPDMDKYRQGTVITSATRQLAWDSSGQGFFSVNTDGTKALVGFAADKEVVLGDVRIKSECPYASIFLTALNKQSKLENDKAALLTVVARSCNTGFRYFEPEQKVLDNGKGPILLEPVKATITIARRHVTAVNVLDHNGRRTSQSLPVHDGQFTVDGARDKTLYYEIVFDKQ